MQVQTQKRKIEENLTQHRMGGKREEHFAGSAQECLKINQEALFA